MTPHSSHSDPGLERLAHAVLFPALGRPTVPRWTTDPLANGLGGFVLFGRDIRSATQLSGLTAALREQYPDLHLSIDEEGGDVTRLDDADGHPTPGNLALGRIDDLGATRESAYQIGLSLRSTGIDWNLAPAIDTAVNPFSPNGVRCFGRDRAHVSRHAAAWIEGLQSAGVSACAKHFPGHGLSGTDAHLGTPNVDLSRQELLEHYLDPFRAAVEAGVDSVMVSHPQVSALDTWPASVSRPVITGLLREELAFDGVVITDALEMQGIAQHATIAEASVRALAAGADALCLGARCYGEDVRVVARAIIDAATSGDLPIARLEQAVERLGRMTRRPTRADAGDPELGLRLAARATETTGDTALAGNAVLVVRLEPIASPAAGRGGGDVEPLLRERGRIVETVSVAEGTYDGAGLVQGAISEFRDEYGSEGDVVLLVRSPHRFDWQRTVLEDTLATTPETVVLDMGFAHSDFSAARGWVRTYGASRACAAAAVHVLAL